jgi:hypothetical protein
MHFSYELHQNAVYPRLMRAEKLRGTDIIFLPWLEGLVTVYAFVDGDTVQPLTLRDLPEGVTPPALHRLAFTNLNNTKQFELKDADCGCYTMDSGERDVAQALCLNRLWVWLSLHFQDDIIVAPVCGDLLLFAPAGDAEKLAAMKRKLAADDDALRQRDNFLTDKCFRYRQEGNWVVER